MFSLFPTAGRSLGRPLHIGRRDAPRLGGMSSLSAMLPTLQVAASENRQSHAVTAKRCIYIFLCGGPSQLDMWDPKPNAPDSIRGPFRPIHTRVPGMQIGDLLPLTAQRADKFAIIRSMTHESNAHDVGISRDNHGLDQDVCGGHNRGVDMIRGEYCCPSFDRAFSALLDDLSDRGMLDDTLVVVTGEFGRTPQINQYSGRDHWCSCYSTVLAGGGIRGGAIYGTSDEHAAYVKDSPVRPEDLGATILYSFGFAPEAEIYQPTGRPVRSSSRRPVIDLFS